jgi:hypothetical protein
MLLLIIILLLLFGGGGGYYGYGRWGTGGPFLASTASTGVHAGIDLPVGFGLRSVVVSVPVVTARGRPDREFSPDLLRPSAHP